MTADLHKPNQNIIFVSSSSSSLQLNNTTWLQILFYVLITSLFITNVKSQASSIYVIDDFQTKQESLVLLLTEKVPPSVSIESFIESAAASNDINSILGGERDVSLIAMTGSQSQIVAFCSNEDENGELYVIANCTIQATSTVILQYDGIDGSMNVNVTGLSVVHEGGLDFTRVSSFSLQYESNQQVVTDITVFDMFGEICFIQFVPQSTARIQVINSPLSHFTGRCVWSNVGAIEIQFQINNNSFFELFYFKVI